MRRLVALFIMCTAGSLMAQEKISDIPYVANGDPRHVLDIYKPSRPANERLPVFFWIHGGGWQAGDKSSVHLKPKVLTEKGFLLVSTNYRLLPHVPIEELIHDVAKSIGWVHAHIAEQGGDPNRIVVGGHSAGAQLAALMCTDERYLQQEGVSFKSLRGCIPVDGDTYDIPKIIMTAELRQALYGGEMPTFGHRQKFGNDPQKHVDLSAVTHVASGKNIPPFLLLYFSGNPDTRAQAERLKKVLRDAQVEAEAVGKANTNHSQLNSDLGLPDDPVTAKFMAFLERIR